MGNLKYKQNVPTPLGYKALDELKIILLWDILGKREKSMLII